MALILAELLYPLLLAFAAGIGSLFAERVVFYLSVKNKNKVLQKLFLITDSILQRYHPNWNPELLDDLLEIATYSILDASVSDRKIKQTVKIAKRAFSREKIKEEKLDLKPEEGKKVVEVLSLIDLLGRNTNRESVIQIARYSSPLLDNLKL